MIIWPLLLVLFASSALAGFSFGAIRAGISFVGLLLSVVIARIFAHSLVPLLAKVGAHNPIVAWLLAPVVVFLIALLVFKIIGAVVQRKVNVYYKYKAGDLKLALWNRLNARLGLCLGLANATIYMVLISMAVYALSYPSYQLTSDSDPGFAIKTLNEAGKELQSSGLAKVAAAVDPMPETYYEAADLAGLLYHNSLLEARLARYPVFLSLGHTKDFQDVGADQGFTELRQKQPPVGEIWNYPKLQPIVNNPDTLDNIWALLVPNFKDLDKFLRTGTSDTYGDKPLLGHWDYNLNAGLSALVQAKPNISTRDLATYKYILSLLFAKTTLLATLDGNVYFDNFNNLGTSNLPTAGNAAAPRGAQPQPQPQRGGRGGRGGGGAPPAPVQTPAAAPRANTVPIAVPEQLSGSWSGAGTNYQMNFPRHGGFEAVVDGDKLTITGKGFTFPMIFDREY